eukprot:365746-Chlamydomonas_euryale.AAC.3
MVVIAWSVRTLAQPSDMHPLRRCTSTDLMQPDGRQLWFAIATAAYTASPIRCAAPADNRGRSAMPFAEMRASRVSRWTALGGGGGDRVGWKGGRCGGWRGRCCCC